MTLEQLSKLDNSELNRMAAVIFGGRLSTFDGVYYAEPAVWNAPNAKWLNCDFWVDASSQFAGDADAKVWQPAVDRNQSGELLRVMAGRGAEFSVDFDHLPQVSAKTSQSPHWIEIPGNDARAETLAALMAAIAITKEDSGK